MRIPITDKSEQNAETEEVSDYHTATAAPAEPISVQDAEGGNVDARQASRKAWASGYDAGGGQRTPLQDADDASDKHNERRQAEQEMEEKQAGGEVDTQTKDPKPSTVNPDGGMPTNPGGNEESSGPNPANEADGSLPEEFSDPLKEAENKLLHLAADFENYKRQASRRETEVRERANRNLIEDILPVLDNFQRALEAARNAKDVESVRVGVEFIAQQLQEVLRNHGVEPIEAQGKSFDPMHHEALEEVAGSGHPEGTVVNEATRGYKYRGQVLRPSRVRVAGKQ